MARKLNDARLGSKARRDRRLDATRAEDSRELDDQERLAQFRMSLYQSILPNLPKIKGYHVIWLTTNNQADSIPARMRMGYEPIKASEVPGFESLSIKTGEYQGLIGVNEMLAFKLPLHLFEMYMTEAHHTRPMEEEQKLSDVIDAVQEQMRSSARGRAGRRVKVEVEEGMEDIVQDLPAPKFRKLYGER
jgi:hypothetical protein